MNKSNVVSRGMLFLLFSKAYFLVSGYIIYIVLTRLLGPNLFGIYGVVIGLVSTISMVFIGGINQATSKFISEQSSCASSIKKSSFELQAFMGTAAFLLFFFFSPVIAGLFNDKSLAVYFRITAPIILFYSFYGVFVGYTNGTKQFKKQALLEVAYCTIKTILISILVFFGFSLVGAFGGFIIATLLIFVISIILFGVTDKGPGFPKLKILKFQVWIMLQTLIINLILNIDLFLLKALTPVQDTANFYAGIYNAALTIARIPYLAVIPLSYVIFPFISEATHKQDAFLTRRYIVKCMRYSAIFLTLFVVLISTNAQGIIKLLYSEDYAAGAMSFSIVSTGMMFFSLLVITTTFISGSGLPKVSIAITGGIFMVDFILNYLFIPVWGTVGAAAATTISMGLGFLVSAVYVKGRFKVFLPFYSFLKIVVLAGILFILSLFMKAGGFLLILKLVLLSIGYVIVLLALKEITLVTRIPFLMLKE